VGAAPARASGVVVSVSRRAGKIALLIGVATAVGLYFAVQLQVDDRPHAPLSWVDAILVNLVYAWGWAAMFPAILALVRRYPLDQTWRHSVPAHLVVGCVVTVVHLVAARAVLGWGYASCDEAARQLPPFARSIIGDFHQSYSTYWVIVFAATAWRAAALRARLAEARLEALRAQLQPHFLFNTLNSVSSLLYRDARAADRMIARLAELLRLSLGVDARTEIPLREELALLGRYLEIERLRFEERLRVELDLAPEAAEVPVPPLLLQPLVENAVRHAVARRREGGRVAIGARVEGDSLVVRVADDGPGLPPGGAIPGVGLSNTRARLRETYGPAAELAIHDAPGGGVVVVVTIPRRRWRSAS
jgi:hypothetical protein